MYAASNLMSIYSNLEYSDVQEFRNCDQTEN